MAASFGNVDSFSPIEALLVSDDVITRQIVLISGQNLKRGALLGKITASGKYTLSLAAASDGSQTPWVILAEDCDATGGDKSAIAYFGATVDENSVIYGTGHTAASTRDTLRDRSILLQSSIK